MIATGIRKEGRLAGGAVTPHTYRGSVFGGEKLAPIKLPTGASSVGLIDKQQQKDPASTIYQHPFGDSHRKVATQKKLPPRTGFNVTTQLNPLTQNVPHVGLNTRGTFFVRNKVTPVVKMQFGANQSGRKPNTAFHPRATVAGPQPVVKSAPATEKVINRTKIPSFVSTGNMWGQSNHSFISGKPNTLSGAIGKGRWQTTKGGVV